MSDEDTSKEDRILRVMKRVLTDIAKDTYTRPGHRHPLSDDTVKDIRHCLSLITAREVELNKAAGRSMDERPRFIDEPQSSVVVPLTVPDSKEQTLTPLNTRYRPLSGPSSRHFFTTNQQLSLPASTPIDK